jgi:DNA polymerase-3 subunit delta'
MNFKIYGHQKTKEILALAKSNNKTPNAYIFLGPKGIGKSKLAKWCALLYNCEKVNPDTDTLSLLAGTTPVAQDSPCLECSNCKKIIKGIHPDILWIEPEKGDGQKLGNIKNDQVKEIRKDLNFLPYEGKYRVIVINHSHRMTTQTQNSLLKILEEPPERTLFILPTFDRNALLPTVLSRSQILFLSPLDHEEMSKLLVDLPYDLKDKKDLIISLSAGKPGAFLNDEPQKEISKEELVEGIRNLIDDRDEEFKKFHKIISGSSDSLESSLSDLSDSDESLLSFTNMFIHLIRDIIAVKNNLPLQWFPDRVEDLEKLADLHSEKFFMDYFSKLEAIPEMLSRNLNRKLITQWMFAELSSKSSDSIELENLGSTHGSLISRFT